jgi:hypothetical protein
MDKSQLLASRVGTATVDVPGVGAITIRGLSREQMHEAGKHADEGVSAMEAVMLAHGLVDPALTVDEVRQWQANSPAGEIQPIVERINELSGVAGASQKDAYKSV